MKVEQTVESLSDPEKASPRRERIKKITGLFKSLKHPGGPTDTVQGMCYKNQQMFWV